MESLPSALLTDVYQLTMVQAICPGTTNIAQTIAPHA
jgi:nicotinic acid phosphoribosyltransferase